MDTGLTNRVPPHSTEAGAVVVGYSYLLDKDYCGYAEI